VNFIVNLIIAARVRVKCLGSDAVGRVGETGAAVRQI
jgi:hypothetical protein